MRQAQLLLLIFFTFMLSGCGDKDDNEILVAQASALVNGTWTGKNYKFESFDREGKLKDTFESAFTGNVLTFKEGTGSWKTNRGTFIFNYTVMGRNGKPFIELRNIDTHVVMEELEMLSISDLKLSLKQETELVEGGKYIVTEEYFKK